MSYVNLSKVVTVGVAIGLDNLEKITQKQIPGVDLYKAVEGLDIEREYESIKQRKSTLSSNKRKLVTLIMQRKEKEER